MNQSLRSVAELQQVLLEDLDQRARAKAHLELSWIAMRENRRDAAVRHLREAVALDRQLAQARQRLRELGVNPGALGDFAERRARTPGTLLNRLMRLMRQERRPRRG